MQFSKPWFEKLDSLMVGSFKKLASRTYGIEASRMYGIDAENQCLINHPETPGKEITEKTNFLQEKKRR